MKTNPNVVEQSAGPVKGSSRDESTVRPPQANLEEILRAIRTIYEPGDVVEVRVPKAGRDGTISGYFDNLTVLANEIRSLDGKGPAVYLTLNPTDPKLLARAANRVKMRAEHTTVDADVLYRRWLLVDCDPKRPSAISSTNEEHKLAIQTARNIITYLTAQGWPDPVLADSGNGAHLLYRLPDLENNNSSTELIKKVLQALAQRFDGSLISVDRSVFNASRVCKAYGTVARKGDSLPDRPHRLSSIIEGPYPIQMVSRELLECLAGECSERQPGAGKTAKVFDLEEWLRNSGLEVLKGPEAYTSGEKWILKQCPFNPEHKKPAIIRRTEGALIYSCLHNSCSHNDWKALRDFIDNQEPRTNAEPPWVRCDNRQLRDTTTDALAALYECNKPPTIFLQHGLPVAVLEHESGRFEVTQISETQMRGRLARAASFFRNKPGGGRVNCLPPLEVVRDVLSRPPTELAFPPLEIIVRIPIFRDDGSLFATPGYDRGLRVLYAPSRELVLPRLPLMPASSDVQKSIELLDSMIGDFPFEDDASRANLLGAILTCCLRPSIHGCTPLALFDAPVPGTGKSLLALVILLLVTGNEGPMFSPPVEGEEWRKQLTTIFLKGVPVVTFDNLERVLDSPELAMGLTTTVWADRLLSTNRVVEIPIRSAFIVTGNNIRLGGDLARRCYSIRLDAKTPRPFLRSGFRHENLKDWVLQNRGEIIAAVLTLAKAWYLAGKPKPSAKPLGSFEQWSTMIGGILENAGVRGFLANSQYLWGNASRESTWIELICALARDFGTRLFTAADVSGWFKKDPARISLLPTALATYFDEPSFNDRLGRELAKRRNATFGDLKLVPGEPLRQACRWRICETDVSLSLRSVHG